ncbi:MAG: transposase [Firmicutes bacterium]|nr:transposase [Bacillota bacterium]
MKRKRHTQEFKDQVIKEALETGNSALVARRHELSGSLVARWVREFKSGKHSAGSNNELNFKDLTKDNLQLYQENDQLKKMLGDKELEIAILKDLIKKKNPHLLTKLK